MNRDHLPVLGVGPIYVGLILGVSVLLSLINLLGWIPAVISFPPARIVLAVIGLTLILTGFTLWVAAVVQSRIISEIKAGHLVTTGVYAWVRHPIYSAFFLVCTGILTAQANLVLLLAPPVFWILLSWMMISTEERWLTNTFGQEYLDYAAKTNRIIPTPPRP